MSDPVLTAAIAWGGPYCGKLLSVAEGRRVIPLEDYHGEYLLASRVDRRGKVMPVEWTWLDRIGEQPEDGA